MIRIYNILMTESPKCSKMLLPSCLISPVMILLLVDLLLSGFMKWLTKSYFRTLNKCYN